MISTSMEAHITYTLRTQRKPFAYIGTCSQFEVGEFEVLFSISSFFKINNICYDQLDSVWIVEMSFIEDDDANLEVTKDYCTLQACSPEVMIIKIANLLADHSQEKIAIATELFKMIKKFNFWESLSLACDMTTNSK